MVYGVWCIGALSYWKGKPVKKIVFFAILASLSSSAFADGRLNIYNWSDYIGEDTISKFEAETGIDVTYDVYDSNEVLEAKMLSGSSGYDVVVPTASFLAPGFESGAYQALDLSKLRNFRNQDKAIQAQANSVIGRNDAGIVYMWGTTGVAYNEAMIKKRLGSNAPTDSWSLILDPKIASKLQDCGIAILDSPTDVLPNVINYLGGDGATTNRKEFEKAGEYLAKLLPHLRYIHSSQPITDMANGDLCVAMMWSGDAFQAAARAEEADNGQVINYYIPIEGTNLWFDMLAMPNDAKNPENAYKFIDFMMRSDVAAANVNYVWYASGNSAALAEIDPEITSHPGIYPSDETKRNLFIVPAYDARTARVVSRVWSRFTAGG